MSDKLYLVGGGRNVHTRMMRRAHRFSRRAFRIGELTIRPNLRVPVTLAFCAKHQKEIEAHIANGTLLVQHNADTDVSIDELRSLLGRTAPEEELQVADEVEAIVLPENPVSTGELTTEEVQAAHAAGVLVVDAEGLGFVPGAWLEGLRTEPPAPPAEPPAGPPETEGVPDTDVAPVEAAETPVESSEAVEAETEVAEAPVEAKRLPEGWEKRTKKELLQLCAEFGVEANDKMSNARIVELLSAI